MLSRCNSCGIAASRQRDFGDFCRARQKLLAKRACEASRAKQILTLQTLAVSQSKSPSRWAKPHQSLADFAPAKPCLSLNPAGRPAKNTICASESTICCLFRYPKSVLNLHSHRQHTCITLNDTNH